MSYNTSVDFIINKMDSESPTSSGTASTSALSPSSSDLSPSSSKSSPPKTLLCDFLFKLLESGEKDDVIKWTEKDSYIFKILKPDELAKLWGKEKNNSKMTYEKMARALRNYYGKGVIEKVPGRNYIYCFERASRKANLTSMDTPVTRRRNKTVPKAETLMDRLLYNQQSLPDLPSIIPPVLPVFNNFQAFRGIPPTLPILNNQFNQYLTLLMANWIVNQKRF